jgi:ribosomal protein S18 acetylase RimI-like enzyme
MYLLKDNERVVGTVILNHLQPAAYSKLNWTVSAESNDVLVVHTLAVHPDYFNCGIAMELLNFAYGLASQKKIKAIRLDVSVNNLPAIHIYEKCGYRLAGVVDLGLNIPGLEWFRCYEKAVSATVHTVI